MPATSFYALSGALSVVVFFVLWSMVGDRADDAPWVTAGLGASMFFAAAIFLREVVFALSNRRRREAEMMLDQSLSAFPASLVSNGNAAKLTIEKNSALIRHIKKKSDAAKTLGRFSEGHREVFDLCDEYLRIVAEQIPNVAPGSPRIAAFRHGNDVIGGLHRYHLMQWAGMEARSLTQGVSGRDRITERLRAAQRAIDVVDFALQYYPDEPELVDSLGVLNGLADSLKVKDLVEKADRAANKGNSKRARSLYSDALYILDKAEASTGEAAAAAERIRSELERLRTPDDTGH